MRAINNPKDLLASAALLAPVAAPKPAEVAACIRLKSVNSLPSIVLIIPCVTKSVAPLTPPAITLSVNCPLNCCNPPAAIAVPAVATTGNSAPAVNAP